MKKFIKLTTVSFIAFTLFNCSSDDKLIDTIGDGVQSGIILRTVDTPSGEYDNDNPSTANFSVKVEVQDTQNGNYTSKINVYASYSDNNGGANNRTEAFVKSISRTEFAPGPNNLPIASITVTMTELRNTLNLTAAQVRTCDVANIRLEAEATDGKKFSNGNASGTISGSYFNSPFLYSANIVGGVLVDTLAGNHTYSTTGMFIPGSPSCGGVATGTLIWTESGTPGLYNVNDMSFGLFESPCWFDSPAFSSSSQVKWFCKTLTSIGTDQYGETWTYTIKSVVGPVMKIEFISSFGTGEGGITTITRQGGVNWPAIMQD